MRACGLLYCSVPAGTASVFLNTIKPPARVPLLDCCEDLRHINTLPPTRPPLKVARGGRKRLSRCGGGDPPISLPHTPRVARGNLPRLPAFARRSPNSPLPRSSPDTSRHRARLTLHSPRTISGACRGCVTTPKRTTACTCISSACTCEYPADRVGNTSVFNSLLRFGVECLTGSAACGTNTGCGV